MPQGTPESAEGSSAQLLRRLASLVYEALLLLAVLWLAGLLFSLIELELLRLSHARFAYQVYLVLVAGAYFVWQWVRGGQTLPMKTWRLRLVRRDGGLVTWKQASLRYVLALAGAAAFGLGFVWAVADREGLFLHDRIAGTRIVRTRHPRSTAVPATTSS